MFIEKVECPFCGRIIKARILSNEKEEMILQCTLCKKKWKENKK